MPPSSVVPPDVPNSPAAAAAAAPDAILWFLQFNIKIGRLSYEDPLQPFQITNWNNAPPPPQPTPQAPPPLPPPPNFGGVHVTLGAGGSPGGSTGGGWIFGGTQIWGNEPWGIVPGGNVRIDWKNVKEVSDD